MKANSLKSALNLVGIIVFIAVLSQINISYLWQIVLLVKPLVLIAAVAVQMITLILKSERWRVLISFYQELPFLQVFRASMYGSLYAVVTPARLGVGFAAPFIKGPKINYPQIFFSIIVDRVFDIVTIVLAGYIGLIVLKNIVGIEGRVISAVTIGIILFLLFLSVILKRTSKASLRLVRKWGKENGAKKWFSDIVQIIENNILDSRVESARSLKATLTEAFFLNIAYYSVYFATVYLMVIALNLNIPFSFVVLSYSVVALLGMLPISVSGIGTRDISLIVFFNVIGIPAEKAIALSLIDLVIMNYGIILLGVGLLNAFSCLNRR